MSEFIFEIDRQKRVKILAKTEKQAIKNVHTQYPEGVQYELVGIIKK